MNSDNKQRNTLQTLKTVHDSYKLTPSIYQSVKRVGLLSYSNLGNFGDRLGAHVVQEVLPSNALVEKIYFNPWENIDKNFDLLIVGIGNSIFNPILTDDLIRLVRQSKKSVGIFGTQYRSEYPSEKMKNLIASLDFWFARYKDDLDLYGDANSNSAHLGDWLVAQFTLSQPKDPRKLIIGDEIWQNLPLDRTIEKIQQHKIVHSKSLHPLLCALFSADTVSYEEQRASPSRQVSGKFNSMLKDIFGHSYPESTQWNPDKDAVINYKDFVRKNMNKVKQVIHDIL
jgi:hypothetical protein